MLVKQEIYCHECDRYIQFEIELDLDGNYTIPCPNCGHAHYRVVEKKRVTDKRWGSSNINIMVTWATTSATSMDFITSTTSGTFTTGGFYFTADGTALS